MESVREFVVCAECGRRVEMRHVAQVYCGRACQTKAHYSRRRSGGIQRPNASNAATTRRGGFASAKSED